MSRIFLVLFICVFCCCKKNKIEQPEKTGSDQDSMVVSKVELQKLNFTEFVLDSDSDKNLLDWWKYRELENIINEIKNGDLSHFRSGKTVVETLINEFTNTVPSTIDEEAIQARILVVKTMYFRLNNIINMPTSTKEEIKKSITDLLESFSNLTYQINKKLERDSQNISKPE